MNLTRLKSSRAAEHSSAPDPKRRKDEDHKDALMEEKQKPRRLPKIGGYNEFSDGLRAYYQKREDEDKLKRRVFSRGKASVDRLHDTFICEGDRTLERIRRRMRSMGLVITKPLKQIWDVIIMGHLQTIYKADFVRKLPELLKEFNVKEIKQLAQALTMRQAGKTTAVQSGLASCILEILSNKDVAFGPTKRQSVAIMTGTVGFIMLQPDGPERIVSKNQEQLIVTPTSAGTPHKNNLGNSILRCLPASERGLYL